MGIMSILVFSNSMETIPWTMFSTQRSKWSSRYLTIIFWWENLSFFLSLLGLRSLMFQQWLFCLQEYPKLSQSYYVLLECLAQDHITFLATLEPRVFLYILESIAEGLKALGSMKFPSNFTGQIANPKQQQ